MLDESRADVPFAVIYLTDADGRLARRVGVAGGADLETTPAVLDLDDGGLPWPIAASEQPAVVGGRPAIVTPVVEHGGDLQPAGFLLAGISERLPLDDGCRSRGRGPRGD